MSEITGLKWGDKFIENGIVKKYYSPHAGQLAILQSQARYLAAIAGKHAGKTSFAPLWLSSEIAKNPTGDFLITAPTYKVIRQGILPEWLKFCEGTHLKGHYQKTDSEYKLPTGGKVYIRSLENPDDIEAIHAHAIVCDEAGRVPYESFEKMQQRVSGKFGRILLTTSPYRRYDWLKTKFIDRYYSGDEDYFVSCFSSRTNPSFPIEEYERAKRSMPAWKFRFVYEGEFTEPEGLVFENLNRAVVDLPPTGIPSGRLIGAIDWGGHDPTCILVGVIDSSNCLWVFYERYTREDIFQTAKALKTWQNELYKHTGKTVETFWCDHRPESIKALKRYRINEQDDGPRLNCKPAYKGNGSIEYGINLVNAYLRTGQIKIVRGPVKALIREAEGYTYDQTDEGEGTGRLLGSDHAIDALRYLLSGAVKHLPINDS